MIRLARTGLLMVPHLLAATVMIPSLAGRLRSEQVRPAAPERVAA